MSDPKEVAEEIVANGCTLLCMDLRFITRAVLSIEHIVLDGDDDYSSDSDHLYYHADRVIRDFREDPNRIPRTIAHMVMHIILGHSKKNDTPELGLAEDMIVEYSLDMLDTPNISVPGKDDRIFVFERILKKANTPLPELFAEEISKVSEWQRRSYPSLFCRDSHNKREESEQDWMELTSQMLVELEGFSKNLEGRSDALLRVLRLRTRKKTDYRTFLRKFMISKERVKENPDEFDPAYYTFGLNMYGNLPLIDSVENSDAPMMEDFVIAIDTSGSTMRGPVVGFIRDVYDIMDQCQISRRTNLHIIQCDDLVRSDDVVRSKADMKDLIDNIEIRGGKGTDFRPVFQYVDSLIAEGEIAKLRGLIYFTDGIGTYPTSRPDYPVAFLFCDDSYLERKDVPIWAMKIMIGTEDLNP